MREETGYYTCTVHVVHVHVDYCDMYRLQLLVINVMTFRISNFVYNKLLCTVAAS